MSQNITFPIQQATVDIRRVVRISGKIIARNMNYETFLDTEFGEKHVEWVNGVVIERPSIDERHDALIQFLRILFSAFLELTGGGRVVGDPMIMRLEKVPSSRAPDIQVLLPERLHQLKKKEVVGAANLVVEVMSPGSKRQDKVEKYREYELGGVPEYWIIDPEKQEPSFFQLSEAGLYEAHEADEDGLYHSRSLNRLVLPVEVLWRKSLPGVSEILGMVNDMLNFDPSPTLPANEEGVGST